MGAIFKIELSPKTVKFLDKADDAIAGEIRDRINELAVDPRPRGYEQLHGTTNKTFRVKCGRKYRIVYEVHDARLFVFIVEVGDRKEIYRRY